MEEDVGVVLIEEETNAVEVEGGHLRYDALILESVEGQVHQLLAQLARQRSFPAEERGLKFRRLFLVFCSKRSRRTEKLTCGQKRS